MAETTIGLKVDELRAVALMRGWYTVDHIAQELDVSRASVSRALSRKHVPSPKFIAAVLRRFPQQTFNDFFEVVEKGETTALKKAS